ncbi:MAG: hypothetical protein MK297_04280 [Planctomycetes bacterium]|nr:hypothetical protein [Planctomycetota bacterium]
MRITSLILLASLITLGLRFAGGGLEEYSGTRTTNWPSGSPREEAMYADGLREGLCKRWHADGKLRATGSYKSGQMVDEWHFYDLDGGLDTSRSGIYADGKRVGSLAN